MTNHHRPAKRANMVYLSAYLFPLAAAYALIILPWSLLALLYNVPAPPGVVSVYGHAHELLAGYALLVLVGYLLGRAEKRLLFIVAFSWVAARIAFLFWPGSILSYIATFGFVAIVAKNTIPRFLKSAKKWRNKAIAPILGTIFFLAFLASVPIWESHWVLYELLLAFVLLMFFMGGVLLLRQWQGI